MHYAIRDSNIQRFIALFYVYVSLQYSIRLQINFIIIYGIAIPNIPKRKDVERLLLQRRQKTRIQSDHPNRSFFLWGACITVSF